jgi:hypothetical protein
MDLRDAVYEAVIWFPLAQNSVLWWLLFNTVMNFRSPAERLSALEVGPLLHVVG